MPNQQVIDLIRQENHPLLIYTAFNNDSAVIPLATRLIKFISEVYRSIEPDHFEGQIVIFNSINDQIVLPEDQSKTIYDKTILTTNTSNTIVLQLLEDENALPKFWENVDPSSLFNHNQVIAYKYENETECFYANTQEITINNPFNCASIYALQYQQLAESLQQYKEEVINSSCTIFQQCWGEDENRIFFVNGPEDKMQESLEQHLRKSIRGVDVVREYNVGASKPVDLRVYWKEANRQALIELKWLGKARKPDGEVTNQYSDRRANDGALQIKEYLDTAQQDTPTCISKGYLAVVDGRRYRTNKDTVTIDRQKGLHFRSIEIEFNDDRRYFETMNNYEEPFRFFVEPVCID